jgi:hypothetical protein
MAKQHEKRRRRCSVALARRRRWLEEKRHQRLAERHAISSVIEPASISALTASGHRHQLFNGYSADDYFSL